MCILAIQYKSVPDAPILVAANRDEFYDRPSTTPSIQSGKPRILSGVDQQAGGTWLGVNQHGLFVDHLSQAEVFRGAGQSKISLGSTTISYVLSKRSRVILRLPLLPRPFHRLACRKIREDAGTCFLC